MSKAEIIIIFNLGGSVIKLILSHFLRLDRGFWINIIDIKKSKKVDVIALKAVFKLSMLEDKLYNFTIPEEGEELGEEEASKPEEDFDLEEDDELTEGLE